jgi:hypothetical protein
MKGDVSNASLNQRRRSRRPRPWRLRLRRGAMLVMVLVCLLVSMSLLGGMVRTAMEARRQLHAARDLQQTEWLVQAGADRAAYQLAQDAAYRGETWRLSLNGGGRDADAAVVIEANRDADDEHWQVRVGAEYPAGSERSIRRARTFVVQIPANPEEE